MSSSNPKDRIGISKVPLSLLPPAPQAHVALALLDGAKKYGRHNWRSESVAASIYIDACMRHLNDWMDGEEEAEDSRVHHLGHAAACLFILMDAQQCGNLIDDRPKVSSGASTLFSKLVTVIEHIYQRHGEKVPNTPPLIKIDPLPVPVKSLSGTDYRKPWMKTPVDDPGGLMACSPELYAAMQADNQPKSWPCSPDYTPPNNPEHSTRPMVTIMGHTIVYEDERRRSGTIDGEYFTGTSFTSRVERYRRGYETADDEIAALGCAVRNLDTDPNLTGGKGK